MLSLSLAARQQSRCLQTALARFSASSHSTTAAATPIQRRNGLVAPRPPTLTSISPTLVPARHFQTTASRASAGMDHGKLWTIERLVSLAQIPCFVVPFIATNPVTDAIFCTLLVIHSHWGEILVNKYW